LTVALLLERPVLGRIDRRRAMLAGVGAIALVGAVDMFGSPGGTARLPLWAAWVACFLFLLPFQTRGPSWAAVVSGAVAGTWSMLTLLAMSWVSGGSHSIFFLILMMIPLMTALVAPNDPADPVLQGILGLTGGGTLMHLEGRPWFEILPWATLAGIATCFALVASIGSRRRQDALLRSERERAETIARLATAERARAEIERWAVLGQMADRVAHDVNSPLASIGSNLRFVQDEVGRVNDEVANAIKDGIECAERIRAIVAGLQAQRLPRDRSD